MAAHSQIPIALSQLGSWFWYAVCMFNNLFSCTVTFLALSTILTISIPQHFLEMMNQLIAPFCTATECMESSSVDVANHRNGVEEGINGSSPIFNHTEFSFSIFNIFFGTHITNVLLWNLTAGLALGFTAIKTNMDNCAPSM
ncbi:uncharacterized protein EDB91DRAFT_1080899 [Suillus paluster]|uniref:uncharacterized protein n=1 Tax=Suillus paluster TaxID=48578 RepID=UPI001B87B66D|nr:uncharacterized protein EDB91DRAFT_1080899 [Suillus paluster]KAG1744094.1 hypothetical protein EDB91DRAFT_1080899 [Suillus paluster]